MPCSCSFLVLDKTSRDSHLVLVGEEMGTNTITNNEHGFMTLKIRVTVKPRSKRRELKRIADGEYTASVQAPARSGKANQALIELLSESFSVPKSFVKILLGQTSRKKLVEIG